MLRHDDWSDYVFAKDYNLKPIAEVSQYIQANHHLPNVPSATEAKNVPVGEMQQIMMEKIEELYLYVIDLKEENETLKAEIKGLK